MAKVQTHEYYFEGPPPGWRYRQVLLYIPYTNNALVTLYYVSALDQVVVILVFYDVQSATSFFFIIVDKQADGSLAQILKKNHVFDGRDSICLGCARPPCAMSCGLVLVIDSTAYRRFYK